MVFAALCWSWPVIGVASRVLAAGAEVVGGVAWAPTPTASASAVAAKTPGTRISRWCFVMVVFPFSGRWRPALTRHEGFQARIEVERRIRSHRKELDEGASLL